MLQRTTHPGVILQGELDELKVSPTEYARQIDVPMNGIGQFIVSKRSTTAESALRFGLWFGVDPRFGIDLQSGFDPAATQRNAYMPKLEYGGKGG